MRFIRFITTAVFLASLTAWGAPAAAQSQTQTEAQPPQPLAEITEAKLDAFVDAAMEVSRVVQTWRSRIQNAETQEQAQEMRAQADSELTTVVKNADGITVEEYAQIAQAARDDTELQTRIRELFQEKSGR